MTNAQAVKSAAEVVAGLRTPLSDLVAHATGKLIDAGMPAPDAVAKVAALVIAEVSRGLAAAADLGRSADSRTFEAMFDVNAASGHFQNALDQGMRHAAAEIGADGYAGPAAMVLAASRALDAVADIVTGR